MFGSNFVKDIVSISNKRKGLAKVNIVNNTFSGFACEGDRPVLKQKEETSESGKLEEPPSAECSVLKLPSCRLWFLEF